VVIAFSIGMKAEEACQRLLDMWNEYLSELDDAVIVVKQPRGKVKCRARARPSAPLSAR